MQILRLGCPKVTEKYSTAHWDTSDLQNLAISIFQLQQILTELSEQSLFEALGLSKSCLQMIHIKQ